MYVTIIFSGDEVTLASRTYGGALTLNNVRMLPFLLEVGARYAEKNVLLEHLL